MKGRLPAFMPLLGHDKELLAKVASTPTMRGFLVSNMTAMTAYSSLSRWSGALGVCAIIAVIRPAHAEPRAVIELFTSQGCSSCPPADQLLGELTNDSSLVAVSVPVDYWDYLGWKDTLADPHNTARQKAYAHARGDGQVYTPQVVVNGTLHALGSDKAAIELAIAASRKNGAMSLLPTLTVGEGRLNVTVPDLVDA